MANGKGQPGTLAVPMTYAGTAGVNYSDLDPFKRLIQGIAKNTTANLPRSVREAAGCRGESCYVLELPMFDLGIAHVEEGLGTKVNVAISMEHLTGANFYDAVAWDTVAMIVIDLMLSGADLGSLAPHVAVGDSEWITKPSRAAGLARGFVEAVNAAGGVLGGGETSVLRGIVDLHSAVLAGSAVGFIYPLWRRITSQIQAGDHIILWPSYGICANGLGLANKVKKRLPKGYLEVMPDGRTFGEALLDRTPIYNKAIAALLEAGIKPHYATGFTGHGWRKLMRSTQDFTYVIDRLPDVPTVLQFMQKHGPITDQEAYGNLNMGAFVALFLPKIEVPRALQIMDSMKVEPFTAGVVEEGPKRVVIRPKNLEFAGETLAVH